MENKAFIKMKNGIVIKSIIKGVEVNLNMNDKEIKDLFRYKQIVSDKRTESSGNYYRDIEFKL